ncbi:MAG: peptidase M28 family protein, partial [Bacteroidota bacterium]
MKKIISFLIFSGLVHQVQAQTTDSLFIKKLSDEILMNGEAYDNLRTLTKTIGGRLAGSPQMVKAEVWGLKAMQQAGADNAFMQECLVPHWVRGGKDLAYLT